MVGKTIKSLIATKKTRFVSKQLFWNHLVPSLETIVIVM